MVSDAAAGDDLAESVKDAIRASDVSMMEVVITPRANDVMVRWMSPIANQVLTALDDANLPYRAKLGNRTVIVNDRAPATLIGDGGYHPLDFGNCSHDTAEWKWTAGGTINHRPPVVIIPGECGDCNLPVERTFRAVENGVNQDAVEILLRECDADAIQERLTGEKFQTTAVRHRLDVCPDCRAEMVRDRRQGGRPPNAVWTCSDCGLTLPDPWGVGDARAIAAARDAPTDDHGRIIPEGANGD